MFPVTNRLEPSKVRFASPVAVPSPSDVNTSFAASDAITSDKSTVSWPLLASRPVPAMPAAKSTIVSLFKVPSASKKGIESAATAMAVSDTICEPSTSFEPDNTKPPPTEPEIIKESVPSSSYSMDASGRLPK